jgi:hypothetical protein
MSSVIYSIIWAVAPGLLIVIVSIVLGIKVRLEIRK